MVFELFQNYIANLCKPIYDIINYSASISPFESGNWGEGGEQLQKFESILNEEILNISWTCYNFWRNAIWWKNKLKK